MSLDFGAIVAEFPKVVPVFPLSGVVLFPGATLALHVFEPRYRAMVSDALRGDRLIASALLSACTREEYAERPPFHDPVCVGRMVRHEPLPDGRSNITLVGVATGRVREAVDGKPYRRARVEARPEDASTGAGFRERLERAFRRAGTGAPSLAELEGKLVEVAGEAMLPAALVNACAFASPILPGDKLGLLAQATLTLRLDALLELQDRRWQWN